jgi:hypothetical protein
MFIFQWVDGFAGVSRKAKCECLTGTKNPIDAPKKSIYILLRVVKERLEIKI